MLNVLDGSDWSASSPDALHFALGEGVTDRIDAIESERATTLPDTAELVIVQAANDTCSKSGKCIRAGIQRFHASPQQHTSVR